MITGAICSGKDTASDYLCEKYGFKKIAFADPVYWIAKNIFRMKKKNRRLLQMIGQSARLIYPMIWVRIGYYRAGRLSKQGYNVLMSDCRQSNEFSHGMKLWYVPIRIESDLKIRINRCRQRDNIEPDTSLWTGSVETGCDKLAYEFSHIIHNNTTIDVLKAEIDKLADYYGW